MSDRPTDIAVPLVAVAAPPSAADAAVKKRRRSSQYVEGQHFLLSPKANTLSLSAVCATGEEDAYQWFKVARWPSSGGEPTCPECGCIGANARPKRRFKCKAGACLTEFSVTSGTILASRKLTVKRLVLAIALSVHSVKGKAACQLKRELGVDYKTAFVLLHKLREAIAILRQALILDGVVEMDGMYVGDHLRPKNHKEDRVDGRWPRIRTASTRLSWRCESAARKDARSPPQCQPNGRT